MQMHGHGLEHRGHTHGALDPAHARDRRRLTLALALLLLTMVGELVAGALAGSLALLADAGHMLTDAAALALAVLASWLASRPAHGSWTFGLGRVEVLAAQLNGLALALVALWITVEASLRLASPPQVEAPLVLGVALAGAAVNLAVVWLLAGTERDSLNVRGAYLHVLNDLAAFAGTALAAVLIIVTGWDRFDPLVSLFVAALALKASVSLLRESGRIFLEGAPTSTPPAQVGRAVVEHPHVVEAHDLHVWTVTSGFPALSAHVLVEPGADCHRIRLELEQLLHERFGIDHTTLQVEHVGAASGLSIGARRREGPS